MSDNPIEDRLDDLRAVFVREPSGPFGYTRDNPILGDACPYCVRLQCPSKHHFLFQRSGSTGRGPDGHIVDRIDLCCEGGEVSITLYFDMYHEAPQERLPEGLSMGEPLGRGSGHKRVARFPVDLYALDRGELF